MKNTMKQLLYPLKEAAYWVVFPCASFYLMETFHHNPFANISYNAHILNFILFVSIALLLWGITGSRKLALRLQSVLALIIGVAEYYVLEFRGVPILPWDIYAVKTAASVSSNYSFALSWQAILSILAFALLIFLEGLGPDVKLDARQWRARVGLGLIALFTITSEYQIVKNPEAIAEMRIYDKLFTPYAMIKRDGIPLAFMMELQYMEVEKPKNYDKQEAQEAYKELEADEVSTENRMPNIIVIMDEAFSDLSVLGDFTTNEDYMPVLHSLQQGHENTVTGHMNVSVVGGNTANTEFEFLTGSTMAFLPDGCVPYQQYIDSDTDSLASHLKGLGYKTIAMHPYNAGGWERNIVYPYLGFDTFYSLKDFSNVTKVREYVSDDSCVDRIIKEFERAEEPLFLFNVTMQNHSSYTAKFDNFTPNIKVEGSESFQLSSYLSLMQLSDAALGRLIEYFEQQEEETVIVFFGDHQPSDSVVKDIWTLNGADPDELTEEQECLRYQVPFVVWANFDIEEQTEVCTSANFLGAQVFEWCNIPQSGYQKYLLELTKEYSAISARTAIRLNGEFVDIEEIEDKLSLYNMLQYYRIFG